MSGCAIHRCAPPGRLVRSAQSGRADVPWPGSPTGSPATPAGSARDSRAGSAQVARAPSVTRPPCPPRCPVARRPPVAAARMAAGCARPARRRARSAPRSRRYGTAGRPAPDPRAASNAGWESCRCIACWPPGSISRTPGSPPCSGPPTSVWNLLSDCTEFQPGAQKRGMSAAGGSPRNPSIEKASGESGSSGGLGSLTATFGVHGRAAAVAMRLARDLLARQRGNVAGRRDVGDLRRTRGTDRPCPAMTSSRLSQAMPVACGAAASSPQPAPALLNLASRDIAPGRSAGPGLRC